MQVMKLLESLTEEALILRLRSTEHDFVERKSRNDKGDWLQTAVAFANSAPIGWPAVLFVGVDDNGKPQQQGLQKLEDLMKSVSDTLDKAYPAIYRHIVPVHLPDGDCLAVVIPGSEARPHFAGKSYIRDGPQTKEASTAQFERLIVERTSKAREILKHIGEGVIVEQGASEAGRLQRSESAWILIACNQFFVTVKDLGPAGVPKSFPLERVQISSSGDKLKLEVVALDR
jgi:predicted HTH transcriptional regulator